LFKFCDKDYASCVLQDGDENYLKEVDDTRESGMDGGKGKVLERLSRWDASAESLAPLDESMLRGVELLEANATVFPPIPRALPLDDIPDLIPKLSNLELTSSVMSKELERFHLVNSSENQDAIETKQLESAEDFLQWMQREVEVEMLAHGDSRLDSFRGFLDKREQECVRVNSSIGESLDHLSRLQSEYQRVSDETNQLHSACEQLLSDQGQLGSLVESIDNKLAYFSEWEKIAPRLESDSVLTVTSESFVPTLARIDECIAYLRAHPHYREAPVYLAKFQASLTRALTLIRAYVVTSLETATRQVLSTTRAAAVTDVSSADEPAVGTGASTTNAFTLFYGRFRTRAPRIKALMEQLELRQNNNANNNAGSMDGNSSSEYAQLLSDCHQCYVTQRQTLLAPSVSESIRLLSEKHSRDHCTLVRSGCAFLIHMCQDEYQLFFNFFSVKPPLFDAFLESLCLTFYDLLRPLIIHINHLETLAELCSILKVEMMEQSHNDTLPFSSASSVSGFSDVQSIHSGASSIYGGMGAASGISSLRPFATIAKQLLEDVQERLVYRAHVYSQSDILGFNPSPGDLAYPDKLKMMRDIALSLEKGSADSGAEENAVIAEKRGKHSSSSSLSPADLHGMWYPTVRRTLVTLSKLYRCVDKAIFQGLSQDLLTTCIKSLVTASLEISSRKTPFDGRLFLIKHLLIMREQIAPFQVDFLVKETSLDFSAIKSAAVSLYKSRSNVFHLGSGNALLKFLLEGTPQVREQLVDSRKDVDWQLKKTCEEFIHLAVSSLVSPIRHFLEKATYLVGEQKTEDKKSSSFASEISTASSTKPLRLQPFATPEKLHDMVGETNKLLRSKLPKLLESMTLYLANKETESILFKPIKVGIQEAYRDFRRILDQHYRSSAKPKESASNGPKDETTTTTTIAEDDDEDIRIIACPEAEELNLLLTSIIASACDGKKESTPALEAASTSVSATPPPSEMSESAVSAAS